MTDDKDIVYRLRKELYGLKKAPRTYNVRLDKHLTKLGYSKGMAETDDALMILVILLMTLYLEEMMKKVKILQKR